MLLIFTMDDHTADRRRTPRPQVIVVAEDAEAMRQLWQFWLGYLGFEVLEASTGTEALALTSLHSPIAVVMDLAMPVMDGLEATRRLRQNPRTAHVPVVMVSAFTSEQHRRAAAHAGCAAFLAKPTDPQDLIEELRRVLARA